MDEQLSTAAGEAERATLIAATARTFATLHAERFENHGRIVGGGASGLELDTAPWTDVLTNQIEIKREIAPAERFPEHFDVADRLEEELARELEQEIERRLEAVR